jgi:hypothetical protein
VKKKNRTLAKAFSFNSNGTISKSKRNLKKVYLSRHITKKLYVHEQVNYFFFINISNECFLSDKIFAKVRFFFFTKTVFDACLWKYKSPTYKANLFNKPYDKKDPNPPQISSAASNPRERRSSPGGCEVKQLEGRDITDTAFLLEVSAKSDVSDIKLSYAIGTHRSGNNVQDWTGMTGNSLTAPVKLKKEHYGIPLFFTIKAKNSQGTEAITECSLKTYDNTVPEGRIGI